MTHEYWRWKEGTTLEVYALVEESVAYVGISSSAVTRITRHDHKDRRHRTLLILESNISPVDGFDREQHWHDVFRDLGMTLESMTWREACSEGGKVAGATGKKNLANWWNEQSSEFKRAAAMRASNAASAAGAYLAGAAANAKIRATCEECGKESNCAGLARHQKSSGHTGIEKRTVDA